MVTNAHSASGGGVEQKVPTVEELLARRAFTWVDVIEHAGGAQYVTGKHGPCPMCGGTDRFRYIPKIDRWGCYQCTHGETRGMAELLMHLIGTTKFRELADYVRRYCGYGPGLTPVVRAAVAPARKERVVDREQAMLRMERIWAASRPISDGDPVDTYLRRRLPGLGAIPPQLRLHPRLDYWERGATLKDKPVLLGTYPAMVVRGFDAEGNLVQIHKTFLTTDGRKAPVPHPKKTEIGVGANSFAFRLLEPEGDELGVAEGIETALAATIMFGIPVWPCHSASILANFVLPAHLRGQVKRLIIFTDSDELKNGRRAGSAAAAALADRSKKEHLKTMIVRPAKVKTDMADLVGA